MRIDTVPLAAAAHRTRTGDLWLFRGRSAADRVIQTVTNSPVNHVGVAVVLDDLPPLLWHAEMGASLTDVWTGRRQRGVQLHDLEEAVLQWTHRYGQRAWFRQLDPPVGPAEEDALLEVIARWNGVSFPTTVGLATRWLRGRTAERAGGMRSWIRDRRRRAAGSEGSPPDDPTTTRERSADDDRGAWRRAEAAYCAEVAGLTLEEMGILRRSGSPSWYDPGRFWSGDALLMNGDRSYGREIAVTVPDPRRG